MTSPAPETSPLVSVIIPTFNRRHLIGRALESVLRQTYPNWECLVVDDASTDDTEGVVRSFGDPRILYLRHDSNRGGSAARNTGIEEARGDYLAFLDSDDEWLPSKLQRQIDVFISQGDTQLGAVLCGRILVTQNVQRPHPGPQLGEEVFRTVLTVGLGGLGTSGFVIHNRVIKAGIRFDESFPACQDRDFMTQIANKFRVQSVSEPLIKQHRDQGDRHLWSGLNAARGLHRLIDKYSLDLRRWPSDLAKLHISAGIKYVAGGEARMGRQHFTQAIQWDPFGVSPYLWFAASIFGHRPTIWLLRLRS